MRFSRFVNTECAATRERISLELDDRLSELDRAYLRAHVGRCANCRAYQRSVLAATRILRAEGLEEPGFTIAVPRRRRVPIGALQATAGAAALAFVAALANLPAIADNTASPRGASSATQHAFLVRHGKFVPAANRAQRPTTTRIAL